MYIFVIDYRHALQKDCRFVTALKILRETAIFGRAILPNKWTHFGLTAVGKKLSKVVLQLQDMKCLSLLLFNRAFDELEQLVQNEIDDCESSYNDEVQQKSRGSITFALQSSTKQFKELKGKKEKNLIVIVLTTRWERNVKREVRDFLLPSSRETPIDQIHILEMNDDKTPLFLSDRIHIHSLPSKGFDVVMKSVCKKWLKRCPFVLKLKFPNNGPQLDIQVEDLFIDPHLSKSIFHDEFPEQVGNLMITSVASLTDLSEQYRMFGRCHLVSGTKEKFQDYHRWMALCQTTRNDESIIIVQNDDQPLFLYALVPCHDSRMILQPIARSELELPVFKTFDSNVITSEFESAAKTLPLLYEYGLGSDSQLMTLLQRDWTKYALGKADFNPTNMTRFNQQSEKTKNKTNQKYQSKSTFAHPALGLY